MSVSRGHKQPLLLPWIRPAFPIHFKKCKVRFPAKSPILSQDPAAPGGALEGLSVRASWLTMAAGGCTPSSSV